MFYITCMGGFFLIVVQWFFFCFESCCKCCVGLMKCSSFVQRAILFIAFTLLTVGTGLTYYGRNEFQAGCVQIFELSNDLSGAFVGLTERAESVQDQLTICETLGSRVNLCDSGVDTSELATGTETLNEVAAGLVAMVDGLGGTMDRVGTLFDVTVPSLIDWGIGLMTAFMGMTVFYGLYSVTCGSTREQKFMIGWSCIALTLFCPLIAFELTFSVVLSDFCVGLSDNDASLMVTRSKTKQAAAFTPTSPLKRTSFISWA
jgi:hypothetical protein